jgi:predicted 3-demethylubiquinone-9 3-methyltransferase (glyoxalase superfamily)
MQKITPCLWFDDQAEEAASFYTSIFKNSKITEIAYFGEGAPRPANMVMTVTFEIEGQEFVALNGGPEFKFTPAVSFSVDCHTQEDVDYFWQKLSAGGEEGQCGWLTDKYGVSWQIVPSILNELLQDKNKQKAKSVMQAMLPMKKLDIALLKEAYARG